MSPAHGKLGTFGCVMKCFNSYSNAKVNEYHQGLSTIDLPI